MENPRGEFGNSKGKDLGEIKGRICNIVERIQEEFAKIKEWTQENQSKVGSLKGIFRVGNTTEQLETRPTIFM